LWDASLVLIDIGRCRLRCVAKLLLELSIGLPLSAISHNIIHDLFTHWCGRDCRKAEEWRAKLPDTEAKIE
jgi:hypothetical protein